MTIAIRWIPNEPMQRIHIIIALLIALSCSQLGLQDDDDADIELNLLALATLQSSATQNSFVSLHRSTDLSVADATLTAVTFDRVVTGNESFYNSSTPSRISFSSPGTYLVGATVQWTTNGTGYRQMHIARNGDTTNRIVHSLVTSSSSGSVTNNASGIYTFSAGDYIELYVYQNSGGALNAQTSFPRGPNSVEYPNFWATKID